MSARLSFFIAAVLALGLASSAAFGAPRDKAALKKIEEAIYTHFLNTNFDKAEGILLGTIRACEDKCSPSVKAKAWMYVGIVRGSGRNDLDGATKAFNEALTLDPNAPLDAELAHPAVKQAWEAAVAAAGAAPGEPATEAAPEGRADFNCALDITEVQSRRKVPIACGTPADVDQAKLYFKGFAQSWDSVEMSEIDGEWQGTIPCSATEMTGQLRWYIEGYSGGSVVAGTGSKNEPNVIEIVDETSEPTPAFPGESPPARCSAAGLGGGAPTPTTGECGGWGEACGPDDCCDAGLVCLLGTCEAEQCETDADCESGDCVDGKCEGDDQKGAGPKNWIGLHAGLDITSVSTDAACTEAGREEEHFNCFIGDESYFGPVNENAPGAIEGGLAPATIRLMASYERTFGSFGAELRVGFALNGGKTPQGGSPFLPVHVEARGKYWFSDSGFKPWMHLGGGLAQVDTTIDVEVGDCSIPFNDSIDSEMGATQCAGQPLDESQAEVKSVETTKVIGNMFATVGGGFMYAIGPNHGPLLNLNLMILFPNVGFALEPSLGYAFGF